MTAPRPVPYDHAQTRPSPSRRSVLRAGALAAAGASAGGLWTPAQAATTAIAARSAVPADSLRQMFGVVAVTSTSSGVWGDRAMVKKRLQELGVVHLRNRLFAGNARQYAWIRELIAAGHRFDIRLGDPDLKAGTPEELVRIAAAEFAHGVSSFEGSNEWNINGGRGWASEVRAHQQRCYRAVRGRSVFARTPVIGPSLALRKGYDELGDLSGTLTVGNIHLYQGGFLPGYRLDDNLRECRKVSGSKPVAITETGWHNAPNSPATHNYTPEDVAGVYAPRVLLEYALRRTVSRFFIYHLVDERVDARGVDHEAHFGLLRSDFSKKPAFHAFANLMALLRDRPGSFSTRSLSYGISNAPSDLRQVLVQRSDGTHVLFLWRSVSIYDPNHRRRLPVSTVRATVDLGAVRTLRTYQPSRSRSALSSTRASRISVPLGAEVVAIEVD